MDCVRSRISIAIIANTNHLIKTVHTIKIRCQTKKHTANNFDLLAALSSFLLRDSTVFHKHTHTQLFDVQCIQHTSIIDCASQNVFLRSRSPTMPSKIVCYNTPYAGNRAITNFKITLNARPDSHYRQWKCYARPLFH